MKINRFLGRCMVLVTKLQNKNLAVESQNGIKNIRTKQRTEQMYWNTAWKNSTYNTKQHKQRKNSKLNRTKPSEQNREEKYGIIF